MEQLIAVTVVIGDRTYRIKISPGDEEVVRKSIKTINDKILEFKTQFAGKDMQDYIAMVLLWYATEQHTAIAGEIENKNIRDKLNYIEKLLNNQSQ